MGGIPRQDATSQVSRELGRWGLSLINYIDGFLGVAPSRPEAESHFAQLQGLLETLGLQEAPLSGHGVDGVSI